MGTGQSVGNRLRGQTCRQARRWGRWVFDSHAEGKVEAKADGPVCSPLVQALRDVHDDCMARHVLCHGTVVPPLCSLVLPAYVFVLAFVQRVHNRLLFLSQARCEAVRVSRSCRLGLPHTPARLLCAPCFLGFQCPHLVMKILTLTWRSNSHCLTRTCICFRHLSPLVS